MANFTVKELKNLLEGLAEEASIECEISFALRGALEQRALYRSNGASIETYIQKYGPSDSTPIPAGDGGAAIWRADYNALVQAELAAGLPVTP